MARLWDWGERRGHWACQGAGKQLCCARRCVSRCDPACVTPPVDAGVPSGGWVYALNPLAVTPCSFIPQPLENVYLLSVLYISCKWGHSKCAFCVCMAFLNENIFWDSLVAQW